jgi:threonine synthase
VIDKGERVAVISTANGLKFTEFKVRYHEGKIDGVDSNLANPPVMLPPDYGQVVDAINARFG